MRNYPSEILAAALAVMLFFAVLLCLSPGVEAQNAIPSPFYPPDPFELKGIHLERATPVQAPGTEASPAITPGDPCALGSISGRVVERNREGGSDESKGISGATVQLFDGAIMKTAVTGRGGAYAIEGIKPGRVTITVSHVKYRPAEGSATVTASSQPAKVLIALAPLVWKAEKGYINVYAQAKDGPDGKPIGVTSIRVHESGNLSHRWYNSWSGDYGSSQHLYCENARVGAYFDIKVTWRDGTERTTSIRLKSQGRDVSLYY